MLKKILPIFLIFVLSSCFYGEGSVLENSVQKDFVSKSFTMKVPSSWDILEDTSSILPKPSNGEIVFDAVSRKQEDNFYRNMLVLKQNIKEDISSLDFTIGNYISSKKEYFYTKLLRKKNVIIDFKKTKIYEFEARYSEDTPIVRFLQTGIVCDKKGFLITIALEKNNKNPSRYEGLLGSFVCTKENN